MYSLYLTLYETDIFLRWTYLHVVPVPNVSVLERAGCNDVRFPREAQLQE